MVEVVGKSLWKIGRKEVRGSLTLNERTQSAPHPASNPPPTAKFDFPGTHLTCAKHSARSMGMKVHGSKGRRAPPLVAAVNPKRRCDPCGADSDMHTKHRLNLLWPWGHQGGVPTEARPLAVTTDRPDFAFSIASPKSPHLPPALQQTSEAGSRTSRPSSWQLVGSTLSTRPVAYPSGS